MNNFLRFARVFALGTWLGGIIFFSFVVAPAAFGTLVSRDRAGSLVSVALGRLHLLGIIAGIIFLLATIVLEKSPGALLRPAALAVFAMVILTVISQQGVTPRMQALRNAMGSVAATGADDVRRVEFGRLHGVSVGLEGGVLLLGLGALYASCRRKAD
ncbi:MAG: DUF4149 domain-containing protein [Candidatus Acidiferrales bacterium]